MSKATATYDVEDQILVVEFDRDDVEFKKTIELEEARIMVDYNAAGEIVAIEILNVEDWETAP